MAEKLIPEVSVAILEDGITVKGTVTLNYEAHLIGPSKRFTGDRLKVVRLDMQRAWEEKILDIAAEVIKKHGEGVLPLVRRMEG